MEQKHHAPTWGAMGFSDILDATFSLYREHFRLFFRIVAVYCVSEVGINTDKTNNFSSAHPVLKWLILLSMVLTFLMDVEIAVKMLTIRF